MANQRTASGSRARTYSAKRKKSSGSYVWALYAVCLVLGIILGAIIFRYVAKDDGFTMIGDRTVTVAVGSDPAYTDPGAAVRRFGIDFSGRINVETNLTKSGDSYLIDTSAPGSYYISYTADVWGFGGVKLIRTIRVTEDEISEGK